jgi:hypothetical protein
VRAAHPAPRQKEDEAAQGQEIVELVMWTLRSRRRVTSAHRRPHTTCSRTGDPDGDRRGRPRYDHNRAIYRARLAEILLARGNLEEGVAVAAGRGSGGPRDLLGPAMGAAADDAFPVRGGMTACR